MPKGNSKERNPALTERNKRERKEKRERRHKYWKDNKEYQERQAKRKEKLASYKPGSKFHLKAINEEKAKIDLETKKLERRRKRIRKPDGRL